MASFEGVIETLLSRKVGMALTRQEIGNALKSAIAYKTGMNLEAEIREAALEIIQALSPQVSELVKGGTDVIDQALTILVRRGSVHMILIDMEAHFWIPERRPVIS